MSSQQDLNELATDVRVIGQFPDVKVTENPLAITVEGAPYQLDLAAWLVARLDVAASREPAHSVSGEFAVRDNAHDLVRVFGVRYAATPADFQSFATCLRSVSRIPLIFVTNNTRLMVVRTNPANLALAQWIFDNMDQPPGQLDASPRTFVRKADPATPEAEDALDTVRLLHPKYATTVQDLQEMATVIRSVGEIRMLFADSPTRTILVRSTAPVVDFATAVFSQLDQQQAPPSTAAPFETSVAGTDELLQIIYLPAAKSVAEFQTQVTSIRKQTGIRRVFTYNRTKAMVVRGTPSELAQAGELVKSLRSAK